MIFSTVCEVWGQPGILRRIGYLQTLCDAHANENNRGSEA